MKILRKILHYICEGDKMFEQKNLNLFEKIYNDTYNSLLKYVICKCSNVNDINDIIQDTYLEFYNKLTKENSVEDYNKYLFGICKNIIKKHYRIKYKLKEFEISFNENKNIENISDNFNLELSLLKKEQLDSIFNYLKKKKVLVFKVFYLFYHDELSIKDISKELNISLSKTKNILYRTLKEIKEMLKKEMI